MILSRQTWGAFEEARTKLITSLKDNPKSLRPDNFWVLELMSPQERGPLMEKRHIVLNEDSISKVNASLDKGDFCSNNALYYEYKFSIMGKNQKCNFVQIRLHQNVDYVLEVYDTQNDQLLSFYVPHEDMEKMVSEFGGLAHGTKKTNFNEHKEYALRPSKKGNGKAAKAWQELQAFKVDKRTLQRIYRGK